ncbi:allantoinase AllB [Actinophytocola oryzae]|uniref:allantoinase n=1 Tax=Actinophytocola oryzae TaxID=502181 RepID=A0A4R7UT52_9PSEU|nr:allantoinase AllB [Actinophytocola oryzae]TDV39779.1 allantoinase [Actinophytocola oryzae]
MDLIIRAPRMVTPDGERSGAVGIRDGVIADVADELDGPVFIDLADDEVLLPGLVDTHVHVNDPGRAEWEGFATATRAAAAGGVTTIVDMPLNSVPPTVDVPALDIKRATAFGNTYVDVGFWGGAVPGNLPELRPLHTAGVFGFKCFLLHSGVEEFGHLSTGELAAALATLRDLDALMIVHAEDPTLIDHAPAPHGRAYADFLASRPPDAEHRAIATVIDLARRHHARVHILHLSSAGALPMIAAARRDGVAVTVETCPHYLTLTAEEVPDGATQFKCCPPIRGAANQDLLWQGLADGVIDCVVSDHSPCTPDLKRLETGDFGQAWGGIAGLQLGLPAVWTAARKRGVPLTEVVRWMSTAPAALVGLTGKGAIEVGRDADLCVLAPAAELTVDAAKLFHRNAVSAYHGRTLTGVVRRTWLRGREVTGEVPHGKLLER